MESMQTGRPVLVPDLGRVRPARWPAFAEGAVGVGLRAVFAFPLMVGHVRLGVLDVYLDHPRELSEEHLARALQYADATTAVLLHLQAHAQPLADGIATIEVLDDRAEVHQATGMIAVQAAVGLAEAVLLLRARSYALGLPVVQVARAVVARELVFPRDDRPGSES